jgi:hypothetical protein
VTKEILVIAPVLLILVMLGLVVPLTLHIRKFKNIQTEMVRTLSGKKYWRVVWKDDSTKKSFLSMIDYDGVGVLVDEDEFLGIKSNWASKKPILDVRWPKDQVQARWVGNQSFGSANRFWGELRHKEQALQFAIHSNLPMGTLGPASRQGLEDVFRSLFPNQLSDSDLKDFALEKNNASLWSVIIIFALMAFGAIDTFVLNRFELIDEQIASIVLNHWVALGTFTSAAVVLWALYCGLRSCVVPKPEAWGISLLLVAMLVVNALPIAKRVDQYLAKGKVENYQYIVESEYRLRPADDKLGLPHLRYRRLPEYWASIQVGSAYPMPMLRGPLGLWQIDRDEFSKPVLAFYQKFDQKK